MIIFKNQNKTLVKLAAIVFLFVSIVPAVSTASIMDTLNPDSKRCKYIQNNEYQLFSDINPQFAAFQALGDQIGDNGCIQVSGSLNNFLDIFFKIFVGIASVAAIVNIAYAGIKTIVAESGFVQKSEWKKTVKSSLTGLLVALTSWLLLSTINDRTLRNGLNFESISNITAGVSAGERLAGIEAVTQAELAEYRNQLIAQGNASLPTPGTGDANGARNAGETTIFGYRDGDGTVGETGDNGIGNGKWSHVSGYTNYTGDPRSQVIALPRSTLLRDFGDENSVSRSGYELFDGDRSLGVFPVGDNSARNLDLSYGLVRNNLDSTVTNSNGWSSSNIRYKPLKNYFDTHARPANPMIPDNKTTSGKTPAQLAALIKSGQVEVIMR